MKQTTKSKNKNIPESSFNLQTWWRMRFQHIHHWENEHEKWENGGVNLTEEIAFSKSDSSSIHHTRHVSQPKVMKPAACSWPCKKHGLRCVSGFGGCGCVVFLSANKSLKEHQKFGHIIIFINLDFPEIRDFPFHNATFWGPKTRVRSL